MIAPDLIRPGYDPDMLKTGVMHIGFGAFHRAHQAVYIDEYIAKTGDTSWGIAAVNLRGEDRPYFETATARTDGYILKTISTNGDAAFQHIAAHTEFLDWSLNADQAESRMADPAIKLVTITVTESGYYLDPTGRLNPDDSIIQDELNGRGDRSIYGFLNNALNRRKEANAGPVTVMCCDNLRQNGPLLARNFRTYLELRGDASLLAWIDANVSFPASMVDRITPKPTQSTADEAATLFNRPGDATVMGEDFIQWVIEDKFATDFPDLSKVGVTITTDVDPYEEAKIRILNGGHTCLSYLAALKGHSTFDEAMRDDELSAHFRAYEEQEVLPALPDSIPFDTLAYLDVIDARFRNANIADSVARICMDGFAKFPIFIAPTLAGSFALGHAPLFGIKTVASWYVFARMAQTGAISTPYVEPNMHLLAPLIADGAAQTFATSDVLWSDIPTKHPEFVTTLLTEIEKAERKWQR